MPAAELAEPSRRAPNAKAPNADAKIAITSLVVEPFAGSPAEWDAFVRAQAGFTHFHLYGWRTVIERVYGHECIYLVARTAGGTIAGALPLVRVQSVLFGHYLVSMPFVNYGGPLGTEAAVRQLGARAVEMARADNVKLLEMRSRIELPLDLPASHRKITVVLDLQNDPDALFKKLDSKLRSQVRKPQKEGVTVRFGRDQVAPFFDVFSRHMRDLGTPAQPRVLFETIAEVFGESVWFGCAYVGERPVACGAGFVWGNEFEMTWASSLVEFKKVAPNMLLYWAFMERACREGLSVFNFGRCSPGSGTHKFKLQWGGRDETLWWYDFAPNGEAVTPSADGGAYSWGPRIWKKLPLGVATVLGPRIVRSIP
jgi:serine/alanine adding enzyme